MSKQRIEIGGEYVTRRHGYPARVVCDDLKSESYPLVVLVEEVPGKERLSGYAQDGHFRCDGVEHDLDLVPKPKRIQGWVNIYSNCVSDLHPDRTRLDGEASANRKACIYIDIPEGEGLPSPVERREQ